MLSLSFFRFVVLSFLISSTIALGWDDSKPFSHASGSGAQRLVNLSHEDSGMYIASEYKNPRAWLDRLEPATIGTVGTGVGVGDFDSDGFPDIFVAMREGRNRLYLNRSGQGFEDATEAAGILESLDWTTGVTVLDLNGDGLSDIYVCFYNSPNRLYLNRGDAKFDEVAERFGLAIQDASSGAFFADYDKDGDLDLYLQTNTIEGNNGAGQPDYLLRNEGSAGFRNVSAEAGLFVGEEGRTLGHSVLWLDYDGDGWEDLYVANDFRAEDYLYLNNGDGTFRNGRGEIPVAPYSSMGSDLGDVNGDGLLDILTTDMATPSYEKHVVSMLTSAVKTRDLPVDSRPVQVMKNALLLNRGSASYVDVAYAWNLAATDWTWSPRLVDLDNDGWQDAFFTNGMIRQFHNADLALAQDRQKTRAAKTAVFKSSSVLAEPNKVFQNREGSGFMDVSAAWGFDHEGVSFGAAVLDFDLDGDTDFIYTNYESPPSVWRNDLGKGNAIQIKLRGIGYNRDAIGAVTIASFGGRRLASKILSNRGYLGSDEKLIQIGLGDAKQVDRLEIIWPDGFRQVHRELPVGHRYYFSRDDEKGINEPSTSSEGPVRFVQVAQKQGPVPRSIVRKSQERAGLLYPFKPVPGPAKSRLTRSDFNRDGKMDTLIVRDWDAPRLLISGAEGMKDASEKWEIDDLRGLWEVAVTADFSANGLPDVFLGGVGINNEMSYRSKGDGRLVRSQGKFPGSGTLLNLNAYDWNGELRLFDGLRDYLEIDSEVSKRIASFRESGQLNYDEFVDRTEFEVEHVYELNHFRSGLLINQNGEAFQFTPLPLEAQYGRVWDAVAQDIDQDGRTDLVLLLGQVSPHYRSAQPENSFVVVFLGQTDDTFSVDERQLFDKPPTARIVGFSHEGEADSNSWTIGLVLENGTVINYNSVR